MRKTLIALAVVLAACSPEPEPAAPAPAPAPPPAPAPAPEPEPEPAPEPAPEPRTPDSYGDDPYLDVLWDRCEDGNYDACDELFWESPLNSGYETFALDRMAELETPGTTEIDPALVLDIVWAGMTEAEKAEICDGVSLFGSIDAAEIITNGGGFDADVYEVAEWLEGKCL